MAQRLVKIPKKFNKQDVWVLASGPSLHQYDHAEWLQKKNTIAVNSSLYIGNWVDVLFFGDAKWYWWNKECVDAYKGYKVSMNICWPGRDKSIADQPDIWIIQRKHGGFERRHGYLSFNHSSGAAAINLAYRLGASRIILLGFDMQLVNSERNYKEHVQMASRNKDSFPYMRQGMENLARAMKGIKGVEVLNANPESALTCFKKVNVEEVI